MSCSPPLEYQSPSHAALPTMTQHPQATVASLRAANANTQTMQTLPSYSDGRDVAVREEMGFEGVRQQYTPEQSAPRRPTNFASASLSSQKIGGSLVNTSECTLRAAHEHQNRSTSRAFATSASYPGQSRTRTVHRDVVPKNLREYSAVGRNIGPHATANVVGGHVGRDMVKQDVNENFTQRTFDDFKEYFNSRGPSRDKGTASVYSLFEQNRIEARELLYKNAPGRFTGPYQHDIRRPGHEQDKLAYYDGFAERPTMKNDPAMVHRQRADEHPNREGLRVQYYDNYATGFEKLENHRRMQHTVEQEIDHTMLHAYNTNPYTVPLGIVPFSGQNTTGLNTANQ